MKIHTLPVLLCIFLFLTGATSFKRQPQFSSKTYGNIANFFGSANDLLTFFEFNKGDAVAEVGAAKAENIGGLALLTDSITFYAQDINANLVTQKNLDKAIRKAEKYKKPLNHHFHLCLGTEKATSLPDNSFDKIILSATFHEFTFMDEMIKDINKKLKPEGKVYILESKCLAPNHKNYSADETTKIMKKHNFSLVKKDGKDINGATGLYRAVFAKNK